MPKRVIKQLGSTLILEQAFNFTKGVIMKKLLIAAAVAGSVLTASVFAGPMDGVINMQTIFTQSKQLKAASVAMKTKFAPMQKHCQTRFRGTSLHQ